MSEKPLIEKFAKTYREHIDLTKPIIFEYIDTRPKSFCNFLMRFDLDFCKDYEGPWSIFFEIFVFLLVQGLVDESLKEKFQEKSVQIDSTAKELLSVFCID